MKDEFVNRMGMFKTTLTTLNSAEHKPIWFNLPPVIFTTKVATAESAVTALEQFCAAQGTATTGSTEEKSREEREAVDVAHRMGRALVEWFRDHNDETNAAKVNYTISQWREFRDQTLKDKLQTALSLAQGVAGGPLAADAIQYGITNASVLALGKEIQEYINVISAPQASIAERKSRTGAMRSQFNTVESKFDTLDNLILQYGGTSDGRHLISAYQASRVVRDLGHGPGPHPQPPAPPGP